MTPFGPRAIRLPRRRQGFTLAELAIVLVIVSLLLGGMMSMLSSQMDQRNWNDTQSRLEAARDALLGYAVANGRLPCPANSNSAGAEVPAGGGTCGASGNNYDYYGGVVSNVTYGLFPAVTVGYLPVDSQGFALDAWGNRIRYAVSKVTTPGLAGNFTSKANLINNYRTYIATSGPVLPYDLIVCASATGILPAATPPSCGATSSNWVTAGTTVVAVLYSPGKNGRAPITLGADEAANENRTGANLGFGPGANDPVFVSHTPTPSTFANGEFDDQVLWISIGTLYSKLIGAGLLP